MNRMAKRREPTEADWERARRLRALRQKRDLSLEDFAHRVGTVKSNVQRWETEAQAWSVDWLPKMCEALGVSMSYLVLGIESDDAAGGDPDPNYLKFLGWLGEQSPSTRDVSPWILESLARIKPPPGELDPDAYRSLFFQLQSVGRRLH